MPRPARSTNQPLADHRPASARAGDVVGGSGPRIGGGKMACGGSAASERGAGTLSAVVSVGGATITWPPAVGGIDSTIRLGGSTRALGTGDGRNGAAGALSATAAGTSAWGHPAGPTAGHSITARSAIPPTVVAPRKRSGRPLKSRPTRGNDAAFCPSPAAFRAARRRRATL